MGWSLTRGLKYSGLMFDILENWSLRRGGRNRRFDCMIFKKNKESRVKLQIMNFYFPFFFSGQARRTLFDVLRDENNFTEICEKRKNLKNRLSTEEISPLSKTAPTESTLEELKQENKS